MTDHILDYVPRFDERSRNFAVRELIHTRPVRRPKQWTPGPILDQGQEGACVGFGWTAEAEATPVPVRFPDPNGFARAVYNLAKTLDDIAGENYEGTSVLAGAKALTKDGLLKAYHWAFNIDDVIDAILTIGPVVLGINWREGMYEAPGGILHATGPIVGGHCILAIGYSPTGINGQPSITLQNSWGPSWGKNGLAQIKVTELAAILKDQGEACVPTGRSYGPKA